MKKILITGGAGYIGSCTVQYFLKKKYYVIVIDNFQTGKNLIKNKNCKYFKINFYSKKTFKLIKDYKISTIIHLAGSIDSNESVKRTPAKLIKSESQILVFSDLEASNNL